MDASGKATSKALKMNEGRVKGTMHLASVRLNVDDSFFDKAPAGLVFTNGFVTITDTGAIVLQDHHPDHRARYAAPFAYREDSGCARWLKFLDEVFLGDADAPQKVAALQEFIGLCLTGRACDLEAGFLLYGPGASNGKSVFLSTVEKLFPREVRRSIPPQKWDHEYYRAALDGALINIVGELPEREILDSESFKQVTSGDTLSGRFPMGRQFEFVTKAGHMYAANRLPSSADLTRGFFRRWRVISFNRSFEKDPQRVEKDVLKAQLADEVPGITAWALQGAARMRGRTDYTAIPSSDKVLADWRLSNDPVALFVRDMCEVVGDDEKHVWEKSMKLYQDYRQWSDRSGRKGVLNETNFGLRLNELGFSSLRRATGVYRPLRLNAGSSESSYGAVHEDEPVDPREQDDFGF
jgi:putative DNA primase/helicase